jgi:hypothetical protein
VRCGRVDCSPPTDESGDESGHDEDEGAKSCIAASRECDYEALCKDLRRYLLSQHVALAECVACRRFEPDLAHIPWISCHGCSANICEDCSKNATGGSSRGKVVYCESCAWTEGHGAAQ